ncbi:MAG: ParB/RepB/Spo0J family partition protein [Clostridia bacterium]|nr:ParB/RepB/Spo0J family partition protein [Clostridia bacterium]
MFIANEPTLEEEMVAAEMMLDETTPQSVEPTAPVIRMIEVEKIFPHPDNPRKNLGDLTELADSIKESGIMQNLTVVPGSYGYTAVIGHRRLAAAKMAGLKTVPCIVRAMSEKEQLAVMLSENMQRSDLTIVEQAGGIQMMLDLGDTVSDVSRQTGLSESTVRRRKNLMKVASVDKLKEAEIRGATLADYEKLLEIKDEAKREKVLESIGTNNFAWELKRAIDAQKEAEKIKVLKQYMDAQAKEIRQDEITEDMVRVTLLYTWQSQTDFSKPLGEEGQELFYWVNGKTFNVYRIRTSEEIEAESLEEAERKAEDARLSEKRMKFKELWLAVKAARRQFMNEYEYRSEHLTAIAAVLLRDGPMYTSIWEKMKDVTLVLPGVTQTNVKASLKDSAVLKLMAVKAYVLLECKVEEPFDWWGIHKHLANNEMMCEFLKTLGYVMSDEEAALLDGSHELYEKD